MSPDFKDQLNRLRKESPTIEAAYNAIPGLSTAHRDDVATAWAYFYPLSLERAYGFFGGENEEVANQAAFDLVDHLVGNALLKYNSDVAKLSPFYDRVAQNFFINYMEREVQKEPPIFYGHLEGMEGEPTPFNEEYPYDGIEENFVFDLMEQEGVHEKIQKLKENLFPAERVVLDLLVEGYTSDEIAAELGRTTKAVSRSMEKIRSAL